MSDHYEPEMADPGDGDMFGALEAVVNRDCPTTQHPSTLERVYLDGPTLVIETTFGRTTVGLRPRDIEQLRDGLARLAFDEDQP